MSKAIYQGQVSEELHARTAAEHIARMRREDPEYRPTAAYEALAGLPAPLTQNEDLL